jgi:hypothetical protein
MVKLGEIRWKTAEGAPMRLKGRSARAFLVISLVRTLLHSSKRYRIQLTLYRVLDSDGETPKSIAWRNVGHHSGNI